MLSNVCFFLFGVIDGIFVGRGVGTNGLGAVNIAMPFIMLVYALFILINVGSVTIFAVRLGKGDVEGANEVFRCGTFLITIVSSALGLIGMIFTKPICLLLGASETFLKLATDYLFWYSLFILPSGLSLFLQTYCRNDNAPELVTLAVVISTSFNVFGDWLLIFYFKMGTMGAALATGVSQTLALLIVSTHLLFKKGVLRLGKFRLTKALFADILVHGLPGGIGELATPITTTCFNLVLADKIGDLGINSFSLICYVASFTVAIFYGTSEGLQPLFGQCYGSKNETDLKYYFKAGLWTNFIGSLIVTALVLLFSRPICALFGADDVTLAYTLKVMPLYAWGFVIMAFNVMISAYLYSTERSKHAIILNVLRSVVVNASVILLLPAVFGKDIIWFSFGIYEILVLFIAYYLLKKSEKNGIMFE